MVDKDPVFDNTLPDTKDCAFKTTKADCESPVYIPTSNEEFIKTIVVGSDALGQLTVHIP